jgi:hypothetical protein
MTSFLFSLRVTTLLLSKNWFSPHLIFVLGIDVFRVADLTHVAQVRTVDVVMGVFDGGLKNRSIKSHVLILCGDGQMLWHGGRANDY